MHRCWPRYWIRAPRRFFDDVPDFHRQVKARLLKYGHTSQLLRETTIARNEFLNSAGYPIRNLQDPATVAWNVSTGLYYKTQPNPPWRLANVRPGVCYLGVGIQANSQIIHESTHVVPLRCS